MLIDEGGGVVDLVVDDDVEVFLARVGGDVGVGEFFGHGGRWSLACVRDGIEQVCRTGFGCGRRQATVDSMLAEVGGEGFRDTSRSVF